MCVYWITKFTKRFIELIDDYDIDFSLVYIIRLFLKAFYCKHITFNTMFNTVLKIIRIKLLW